MLKLDNENIKGLVKKYSPEILNGIGIVGMISKAMMCISPRKYLTMYNITGEEKFLVKYYRLTKSNNWLKMHGYTMYRRH